MFIVVNPFSGEHAEFEDEALANAKAEEVRAAILVHEDYRFTVAKEIVDGHNVTWMNANLDNDEENCVYHVFNTLTGQHERFESLSAAKVRRGEIMGSFLNSLTVITELTPEQLTALGRERLRLENAQSMNDADQMGVTRLGD